MRCKRKQSNGKNYTMEQRRETSNGKKQATGRKVNI